MGRRPGDCPELTLLGAFADDWEFSAEMNAALQPDLAAPIKLCEILGVKSDVNKECEDFVFPFHLCEGLDQTYIWCSRTLETSFPSQGARVRVLVLLLQVLPHTNPGR